ncbi:IS5 family transposase [Streptomyces lutosisoli]|uniref:IS5 family transposase n=1 Tax=Streptomyces lutosisoli TaxID=2665721 RepID=A0ABW2VWT9_9ACTN
MPSLPSWLTEPLWDQFAALLPERPEFHPDHPLGCHRRRIGDRIIFDKMLQLLRFGCSYEAIADRTCSTTTIRDRRDEWIQLGVFARLKQIALESYDRIVGLVLDQIAVDGSITKAPGGGEAAGRSPVDRGKRGLKRSGMTDGYGIPLGRVLAGANRHASPLLAPTLDRLNGLGPLPDDITVHLDAGYDSDKTRALLNERGLHGRIAHKGEKAPAGGVPDDDQALRPIRCALRERPRQPRRSFDGLLLGVGGPVSWLSARPGPTIGTYVPSRETGAQDESSALVRP